MREQNQNECFEQDGRADPGILCSYTYVCVLNTCMIAHTPMRIYLYARTCVTRNRLDLVFSIYEAITAKQDIRVRKSIRGVHRVSGSCSTSCGIYERFRETISGFPQIEEGRTHHRLCSLAMTMRVTPRPSSHLPT